MFDKIDVRLGLAPRQFPSVSNITVHEYKAPTSDSIRLLKEVEEETFKLVVAQFRVENTVVDGIITFFAVDYAKLNYKVVWKFKINGKDYCITETLDKTELNMVLKSDMLKKFFEKVSSVLAEAMLVEAFKEHHELRRMI